MKGCGSREGRKTECRRIEKGCERTRERGREVEILKRRKRGMVKGKGVGKGAGRGNEDGWRILRKRWKREEGRIKRRRGEGGEGGRGITKGLFSK